MATFRWIFPILVGVWKVSEGHQYILDPVTNNQPYNPSNNPISPWIVGGEKVYRKEMPYQLSLRLANTNQHFCGASLVQVNGYQIAITAAHCVLSQTLLKLVGGTDKSYGHYKFEQTRRVVGYVVHEDFNLRPGKNDIAVLFLNKPFKLDSFVNTISLPDPGTKTMSDVLVSGWGLISSGGNKLETYLRKVRLPMISTERCKKAYEIIMPIDDSQFCAGTKGKSPCFGDSGGPAKSIDGNYLAGIVSASNGCGDYEEFPGVFTNVSHFVFWINNAVSLHTLRQSISHEKQ